MGWSEDTLSGIQIYAKELWDVFHFLRECERQTEREIERQREREAGGD